MNRRDLIKVLTGGAAAAGGGALFYRYNHQARERASTASPRSPAEGQFPVQLADVTEEAGIVFQHNSGAFGKKYLPETLGSGCAFLDYDNDGWLDLLLVNGMDWPEQKRQRSTMKLYRNNRNGTFSDVTRAAAADVDMDGNCPAVGDPDPDGLANHDHIRDHPRYRFRTK